MKFKPLLLVLTFLTGFTQDIWSQASAVETFFNNPAVDKCRLSPDAKSLAMLSTHEGFLNVHILDISAGTFTPVTKEKFDVLDFFWSGNDYLVYSNAVLEEEHKLGRVPAQLFAIQKNGENRRPLAFRLSSESNSFIFPELLHRLPEDPANIIVTFSTQGNDIPDVYKMNIVNGQVELQLKNPGGINEYVADETGTPRFGTAYALDGSHASFYRPARSDKWQPFLKKSSDLDHVKPVAVASSGDIGVTVSNLAQDRMGLYKVQYKDSLISRTSTLSHHSCDIDAQAIFSYGSSGFVGVSYEELKPKQIFFDSNFKNLHEFIDQRVPNAFNRVISHNENGSVMILESIAAKRPIEYYRVTLKDGLNVKLIGQTYPTLSGALLRGSNPYAFRASDGQLIHVYLTFPKSYSEGNPVPLMVIPHDGPWSRVTWGIRKWTDLIPEYYAARGFAVLQVNYRGSTGFGKKHVLDSFKNLDRVYLDLVESVRWAIGKGYAVEDKVGISGIGWGGFLALSAMTEQPDMFRFGIAMEGIYDLETYIRSMPAWASKRDLQNWKNRVGNPVLPVDQANLRKWSPIHRINRLKAPVLIYSGARGDRVDSGQSKAFVDALNSLGLPNLHVQQPDRTIPSFSQEARINLFKQVDSFLNNVTRSW
ncbi:MAG: alpha/beta hydrolase family protein [Puniceicoccaceae bacterium]